MLGFAIGSVWRWQEPGNRNALIHYFHDLKIDAIELTLPVPERVTDFVLSYKNRVWLRTLQYISIHAPFHLTHESENSRHVALQLERIERLYREVSAKNVIFHPDNLPSVGVLDQYEFSACAENLPPKTGFGLKELRQTLRDYPKIGLCLDVAHAFLWSRDESSRIVETFGERIRQIHFSAADRKQDHLSLVDASEEFAESIRPVLSLNVPWLIELDIDPQAEQKALLQELIAAKKLLGYSGESNR